MGAGLFFLHSIFRTAQFNSLEKRSFLKLIDKFLAGKANPAEEQMLENYLDNFQQPPVPMPENADWKEKLLVRINNNKERKVGKVVRLRPVIWYGAASLLLFIGAASWWLTRPSAASHEMVYTAKAPAGIQPGSSGAVLTLEDGRTVPLDSATSSSWQVTQSGSQAIGQQGMLVYVEKQSDDELPPTYNTLTTPRGKEFRVRLPDGSTVMLNAASSIRFPTSFRGDERKVYITGEAYFKVAQDASKPFIAVTRDNNEVRVLGTEFNLNAYEDEPLIKTTLLNGRVQVVHTTPDKQSQLILEPGQEAYTINGKVTLVPDANHQSSVAWLNKQFSFDGTDLRSVLRQLSRWYDIDIVYNYSGRPTFSGSVYRSENIEEILKVIAFTSNVTFKWEGRKLIVLPGDEETENIK